MICINPCKTLSMTIWCEFYNVKHWIAAYLLFPMKDGVYLHILHNRIQDHNINFMIPRLEDYDEVKQKDEMCLNVLADNYFQEVVKIPYQITPTTIEILPEQTKKAVPHIEVSLIE